MERTWGMFVGEEGKICRSDGGNSLPLRELAACRTHESRVTNGGPPAFGFRFMRSISRFNDLLNHPPNWISRSYTCDRKLSIDAEHGAAAGSEKPLGYAGTFLPFGENYLQHPGHSCRQSLNGQDGI